MKFKMLIAIVVILGFVLNCKPGSKADSENSVDSAAMEEKSDSAVMEEISGGFVGIKHHSMMQKDTVKLHGDPDYDFATIMKIHHWHGIAIANEEVKYGADTAMRSLARKIKENQEKELKELEEFLNKNSPTINDGAFLTELKANVQKAKDEMNQNSPTSGNFDRDFASLIALHHKHGLDVAKVEVKFGKKAEMKKLAQQMIKQRTKEIKQLE